MHLKEEKHFFWLTWNETSSTAPSRTRFSSSFPLTHETHQSSLSPSSAWHIFSVMDTTSGNTAKGQEEQAWRLPLGRRALQV